MTPKGLEELVGFKLNELKPRVIQSDFINDEFIDQAITEF